MKTDDFENQLRRQPLRGVPHEWRDQVLSSAARQPDHASRVTRQASRFSALHELLWPSPYAWASLAAAWLLVLVLNFAAADHTSRPIAEVKTARPSLETLLALEQHLRLRAELAGLSEAEEAPKPTINRPRTGRQVETAAV